MLWGSDLCSPTDNINKSLRLDTCPMNIIFMIQFVHLAAITQTSKLVATDSSINVRILKKYS